MTPRPRSGGTSGTATWVLDPARTRVTFSVCLLGLSIVEGTFHEVSGSARFDPDRPSSAATGEARIMVESIDTGDAQLDATHTGPGVFDARAHPHIDLVTTSIIATGHGRFRMIGDLTIRDITRPVAFAVDYGGVHTDGRGGRRATMTLTGSVDRAGFGLTRSLIFQRLVGTRVGLRIEAELLEVAGGTMVAQQPVRELGRAATAPP